LGARLAEALAFWRASKWSREPTAVELRLQSLRGSGDCEVFWYFPFGAGAGTSSFDSLLDIAKIYDGENFYAENCEMFYFIPRHFFAWF
jgi:hypothetical protein